MTIRCDILYEIKKFTGIVSRIGGLLYPCPVWITCEVSVLKGRADKNIAMDIAAFFEKKITVSGTAMYKKNEQGDWEMKDFYIKKIEPLEN